MKSMCLRNVCHTFLSLMFHFLVMDTHIYHWPIYLCKGSHKRSHSLGEKEIVRSIPSPAPEQPFRDRSNTLNEKPALPIIRDKYKDLTGEVEVSLSLSLLSLVHTFSLSTQTCSPCWIQPEVSQWTKLSFCFISFSFSPTVSRPNTRGRRVSDMRTNGRGVWRALCR